MFNTLRPRQNGHHFPDDIFKWIFLNENIWIAIDISLMFVAKGRINNIPSLVQIMAWRLQGDKPLSVPLMVSSLTHICVARPQWVKNPVKFAKHYVILCKSCNDNMVSDEILAKRTFHLILYTGGKMVSVMGPRKDFHCTWPGPSINMGTPWAPFTNKKEWGLCLWKIIAPSTWKKSFFRVKLYERNNKRIITFR